MDKNNQVKQMQKLSLEKVRNYKEVFGTPVGKRVLYDLMGAHHFLTPTLTVKNDPIEAAFFEGQRNVVLRILTYLKVDVKEIEKIMLQGEQNVKEVRDNIRI